MEKIKKLIRKPFIVLIILSVLFSMNFFYLSAKNLSGKVNLELINQEEINQLVENTLDTSTVPGVSITLVLGKQTKYLSYGYKDKEKKIEVNQDTLFELGSMSKAYTSLGILLLDQQGKLSLNESVSKYLPWFHPSLETKENNSDSVDIELQHLLYHTSGIPFKTISDIPKGDSEDMLEKTVRTLENVKLDFSPGSRFQYATINYDVLALVIETISGQTYEEFMIENILIPLRLNDTYMYRTDEEIVNRLAQGYKDIFFQALPYNAPTYRGNTAAGYIISNVQDMARWMRIHMNMEDLPDGYTEIINKSHKGNTQVSPNGEFYYGAGWEVHIQNGIVQHGGSNPNFSSMIIMKPSEQLGICVLSNMNSNAAGYIAQSIIDMIEGNKVLKYQKDMYQILDTIFSVVIILSVIIIFLYGILLSKAIVESLKKIRSYEKIEGVRVGGVFLGVLLLLFFSYCLYYLPNILFGRISWDMVNVWGSSTVQSGCIFAFIAAFVFMFYVIFTLNFTKKKEKNYFAIIPLSLINGLMSALIIFVINESFNRNLEYSKELLVYFLFALLSFVYTMKLVQGHLIILANEMVFEKRMIIIDKILKSNYETIESIGQERIYSGLNNDTNAIVKFPEITVRLASDILTILFCLSYLYSKSVYAFAASVGVILLNGFISLITSKRASIYWEKNRDIQDVYFGQMKDLVYGFKELMLHKLRRLSLWDDMKKYSRASVEMNKAASIKFMNFEIYNTLMYNAIFGVVVFIIPLLVLNINTNELRENLFIVFYLVGPFNGIAYSISEIVKMRVSIKRINNLSNELQDDDTMNDEENTNIQNNSFIDLKFEQIVYEYKSVTEKEDTEFILGPISTEFRTGEITFIVGGNGSGKSTLGKLITGIYKAKEGKIYLNGLEIGSADIRENFTAIYSDFYLFKKLYGIDYKSNKIEFDEYLEYMNIKDKVNINSEGVFESINLSAGQKKRLAYAICCMENKPMILFDEWAAEQDPEFRNYFYTEILAELKRKGKCIIVITHDDRYFNIADNIIKLERGYMVEKTSKNDFSNS